MEFFVEKHNAQMPHAAFHGQTPDEMYFGTAANLPAELAAAREQARAARLAANRAMSCDHCPVLCGKSSRKLWRKFAAIRHLALASLDVTDLVKASKHRIICKLETGDIGNHGLARQRSGSNKLRRMTSTLVGTTSILGFSLKSIRVKTC